MSLVKFLLHLCEGITYLLCVRIDNLAVILDISCKIIIDLNLDIVSSNPRPVYWQAWIIKLSSLLSWPGRCDSCGRLFFWANFLSAVLKLFCFFFWPFFSLALKPVGEDIIDLPAKWFWEQYFASLHVFSLYFLSFFLFLFFYIHIGTCLYVWGMCICMCPSAYVRCIQLHKIKTTPEQCSVSTTSLYIFCQLKRNVTA